MPSAVQTLPRQRASADARHLMRYLRSKAGQSPEAIAKTDNVSVKTVKESIRDMEAFEVLNSEGQLSLVVRDMVRKTIPQVGETIHELLTATTLVEVKRKDGTTETVSEPDKTTRIEAVRLVKGMVEVTMPKTPAVALQVNQQNNNNQTATLSSAETTEERLRRLKKKAAEFNLLPPVVTGTPVAIDKGFDPDDADGDDDDDDDE